MYCRTRKVTNVLTNILLLTMYFSYHLYIYVKYICEVISTCTYSTSTTFVCIAELVYIKYDSNPCQLSCYLILLNYSVVYYKSQYM